MPRPGNRVTERNSGLVPLFVAFRDSVNTSSSPIFMAGDAAGCGADSPDVAGCCCRQPASSRAQAVRIHLLFLLCLFLLCMDILRSISAPGAKSAMSFPPLPDTSRKAKIILLGLSRGALQSGMVT